MKCTEYFRMKRKCFFKMNFITAVSITSRLNISRTSEINLKEPIALSVLLMKWHWEKRQEISIQITSNLSEIWKAHLPQYSMKHDCYLSKTHMHYNVLATFYPSCSKKITQQSIPGCQNTNCTFYWNSR